MARACQRGFGTVEVPHAGSGAADQLPAAGGPARIDGGIVSGQRHGPRGDSGARGAPAGNFERLVLSHHVAEARGEAGESHGPSLIAVRCDHTLHTEACQLPHFGEVFAVVHGVDDHQPAVLRRRGREVQLQEDPANAPGGCRRLGPDHDGLGSGQDVLLSRKRRLKERRLQGEHVLQSGKLCKHRAGSHGPHGADSARAGRVRRLGQ